MDRMDRFFDSVASLMSNLLRSCIENSLADLLELMETYLDGNEYEGAYDPFARFEERINLATPQLIHPVTIFLVSVTGEMWGFILV